MNLCSNNHQDICYDGNICPLCLIKEELNEAESMIKKLEEDIDELTSNE